MQAIRFTNFVQCPRFFLIELISNNASQFALIMSGLIPDDQGKNCTFAD
jgi:hypothetical protein